MQFTPHKSEVEKHISSIESTSIDKIIIKLTDKEEIELMIHQHNRHQIIYILSGTLHIQIGDITHFVKDKHLVWIPCGISHRLSSNNRQIKLLTCYFSLDNTKSDKFSIYRTDEFIAHNLRFISIYNEIDKYQSPELYSFLINFLKLIPQICKVASFPTHPSIIIRDNRLFPVLEYIKTHINQAITIESTAKQFGFSVRNLTRMFTNSGIRFVHFLNYHRVIKAIEILTDDAMNIEQTAYEVGFNSPNSFTRVFKQITGESPSKYIRKQNL